MHTKLELYRKVTPLAHLGIWERNLLTGSIYWNKVIREIYEVGPDFNPTLDQSIQFYVDRPGIIQLMNDGIKTGNAQVKDVRLKSAKGNLKWVRFRLCAEFNSDGSCAIIYGTLEDITTQVSVLQKLSDREEQFHHAFEYAPIGMALVSTEGDWLRVNGTLCKMLGYVKEEFLRLTFQDITHPEDLNTDLEHMYQLLAGKIGAYTMNKRYFHKEGYIIWVSLSVTLVVGQAGQPLYFVSQIKDITEQKKYEEILQAEVTERKRIESELIKTLEIVNGQNDRLLNFAHIVSHNLRSHIGNIQMIVNMVGEEQDPEEKKNLLDMLNVNSANLQETLVHLNDVVDVQVAGKQHLKLLNLSQEVNKTVKTLAGSLKQLKAEIDIDVDPTIELEFNPAYLESILLNLLTNGIKYRSFERKLTLRVQGMRKEKTAILQVSDNGIGIDMKMHGSKLFGMYKTFHGNEDAKGIGLFLVKNQVEAMGGRITATSVPKEGTTFTITLNLQ